MSRIKVSIFDVLSRMAETGFDIRRADPVNMCRLESLPKGEGTNITIGADADVADAIVRGEFSFCLFIWNKEQYRVMLEKIEKEALN